MTEDEIERTKKIDLHAGQLIAIKNLRESGAFNGYWLRKLKEKREAQDQAYHTQTANESTRQVIAAYDELLAMMDNDERQSNIALRALTGDQA